MIEKLSKKTSREEVPYSSHPMLSHVRVTRTVEQWDFSELPGKINEIIDAVNRLTAAPQFDPRLLADR